MNIYAYGGKSRFSATDMVVNDNKALKEGDKLSVVASSGILLIAYPN